MKFQLPVVRAGHVESSKAEDTPGDMIAAIEEEMAESVVVSRSLLLDIEAALFRYAPSETRSLRIRLLNSQMNAT